MDFKGAVNLVSRLKRSDAMINVGFEGDEESFQYILRSKMTPQALNTLFNTSIEYLHDQDENIFWPWQWQELCKGPPHKYMVVETMPNHSFPDAAVDDDFLGGTSLFILNVPGAVKEKHLRVWVRTGAALADFRINKLEEAKRFLLNRLDRLETMKMEFVAAERRREEERLKQLQELEKAAVVDPESYDKLQSEIEADKERRASMAVDMDRRLHHDFDTEVAMRPEMLQMDAAKNDIISSRLPAIEEKLNNLQQMYRGLAVRITWIGMQGEGPLGDHYKEAPVDEARGKAAEASWWEQVQVMEGKGELIERLHTWKVDVINDPGGYICDRMVMYSGWPRIRLREAADESVYAWFEPPGEHVVIPDKYVDAPELNMRGASLVRLKHGVGASYDADLFTVYSGGWKAGRRHGFGSEISGEGIYEGDYHEGKRLGYGRLRAADGDEYVGEFGDGVEAVGGRRRYKYATKVGSLRSDLDLEGNPYLTGVANGVGRLMFADGSWYVGQFVQSKPHGNGKYTRSDGVVQQGQFSRGVLHGPGSTTFADGSAEAGLYHHGQLIRKGDWSNLDGHRYSGEYKRGLRHGKGSYTGNRGKAHYEGTWAFGSRHGLGTQVWQDDILQHRLASYWRANVARPNRGSLLYMPRLRELGMAKYGHDDSLVSSAVEEGAEPVPASTASAPLATPRRPQGGSLSSLLGGRNGIGAVRAVRRQQQQQLFETVSAKAVDRLRRNATNMEQQKKHGQGEREDPSRAPLVLDSEAKEEEDLLAAQREVTLWKLGIPAVDEENGEEGGAQQEEILKSREEAFQYLARRAWARPKLSISTISNFDDDSNSVTDVFEEVEQVDLGVTSPEPRPDNENTLKEFIELREKALKRQDQPKEPLLQPRQSDGPSDRDKVPELLFLFAPRNRYKITRQGIGQLAFPGLYFTGPNNHIAVEKSQEALSAVIDREIEETSKHAKWYYDHENEYRAKVDTTAVEKSLEFRKRWVKAKKAWNLLRRGGAGTLEKLGLYD